MNVRLLPTARQDILDSARFYEDREPGLGRRFYTIIERALNDLSWQAGSHPRIDKKYSVKYVRTFPYAIYYYVANGEAHVDAILDTRRDPHYVSDRLQ
ncbi:MAG: type II toxin-antitoxin system RelE/ParE family toxin [Acidobacteria bacterium]|nr:type II toxin-antitoxin system RelE/ParE family toxin [Acidobacteriota bacterium]